MKGPRSKKKAEKKKNYVVIIIWSLCALILLCLAIIYVFQLNQPKNDITRMDISQVQKNIIHVTVYADGTSSAASRFYNSTLTFSGEGLSSGWLKYEVWPTSGNNSIYECIYDYSDASWFEKGTKNICKYTSMVPANKTQLKEWISSGELKPTDKCFHLEKCYRLLD